MQGFSAKYLFIISLVCCNAIVNEASATCPPQGTWADSCITDSTTPCEGVWLIALCPNTDQTQNLETSIDTSICDADVSNCNGVLTCGDCQ